MSDPAKVLTQRHFREALGGAMDSPGYATADLATETSEANLRELLREIDRTRDPKVKALLMQEFESIKDVMSGLMGPVQPPQLPSFIPESGMMHLPYDPRTQKPSVSGGFRPPHQRFMDNQGPMQRPPTPMAITGRRG